MVGRRLSLGLDQNRQVNEVPAIPGAERLKNLQSRAVGSDHHLDGVGVVRGRLVALRAAREAVARQLLGLGRREAEGLALGVGDGAVHGVELQGAGERERGDDLRSEEHTSELQSLAYLVCRLLLEKKKFQRTTVTTRGSLTINSGTVSGTV